jgi:hypothetical protein
MIYQEEEQNKKKRFSSLRTKNILKNVHLIFCTMFSVDGICGLKSASILQYISDIGVIGVDAIVVKRRQLKCTNNIYMGLLPKM